MADELEPCPFCGASIAISAAYRDFEIDWWQVSCRTCGAQAEEFPVRDEAIAAWNTRATPPAEPTDAMIEAGMNVVREIAVSPDAGDGHYLADVYRAMTAAREP